MEVRKLRPEETLEAAIIDSICFHFNIDIEKRRAELSRPADLSGLWGCFVDGVLAGKAQNLDFNMRFDGHEVMMGGVAFVATRPEYRRGGAIRKIMSPLLQDARARGEVFSALYPFEHDFYRKFGYELAHCQTQYSLPTSLLSDYKHTGWAKQVMPDDGLSEMTELYNRYAENYNCTIVRSTDRMKRLLTHAPGGGRTYAWLLGDSEGTAAYLCGRDIRAGSENQFSMTDHAFIGKKGFHMLLGFLYRLAADYKELRLILPDNINLNAYIAKPYEVKESSPKNYMARVVNVPRALALCRKPRECDFILEVNDEFLPENSGKYRVTEDSVEKTQLSPDLRVTVQALAPMLLGMIDFNSAALRRDVEVFNGTPMLEKVFCRKPQFIADYF